jgi:hypothetical protein
MMGLIPFFVESAPENYNSSTRVGADNPWLAREGNGAQRAA